MQPTLEANQLLLDGAQTLARASASGIRIDVDYLHRIEQEMQAQMQAIRDSLRQDAVWTAWRRTYSDKASLGSREQLAHILFDVLGHPSPGHTEKSAGSSKPRHRCDEAALRTVRLPFIDRYLELAKLDKLCGTYLAGILREVQDGYLHPSFNLHTVQTFRSCIARGTLVEVVRDVSKHPQGIPIEDVREGDYVYCYDDNLRLTIRRVLWAGKTGHRKVVRLHWKSRRRRGHVDLTPEHRVRTISGEYVAAKDLVGRDNRGPQQSKHNFKSHVLALRRAGDRLWATGRGKLQDHRLVYECLHGPFTPGNHMITGVEELPDTVDVYDIEVEGTHNFIAGELCVHNSSSAPNFQNIPIRNRRIGELIRRAFTARRGRHLVEVDFSGIEVKVAYCYHEDPVMRRYLLDPKSDMHGDTAQELFLLPPELVEKRPTRDWAKNRFVFPEFYGSVYFQCAPHLWEGITETDEQGNYRNKLPNGQTVKAWLEGKGITELGDTDPRARTVPGTYVHHVKQVERSFWEERFTTYTDWKRRWYAQYLERGWFPMKTGFVCAGLMKRNEVLNYAVQGCLAGHSRVLTDRGWIPIRELNGVRTRVWTGFRWAEAVGINKGRWQRATVKLSSGLVIRCDTRHKFKNEHDQWIDFTQLKEGDCVALPTIGQPLEPSKEITWPFVMGFIIGDGWLCARRRSVSITGGVRKRPYLERIRQFLIAQGYKDGERGGVHFRVRPAEKHRRERYKVEIQSRRLAEFLISKGMDFAWKAWTKEIPDAVWRMTQQEQRDFMEGLWQSDGTHVPGQERNLNMRSSKLLRQVQVLISGLGFDSTIDRHGILRVCWRQFNAKPLRKYPFAAIARQVQEVRPDRYDYKPYVPVDRGHLRKGKDVSQYVGERLVSSADDPQPYRYDRVVSIRVLDKVEPTYTMAVDDPLHQFVADGVITKNSAFHCLLWSLIELDRWIRQKGLKTKIVGQIHDSMLLDVPARELQDVLHRAHVIMTRKLLKAWDWIIIPMETETEVTPLEGCWHDKAVWVEKGGIWQPKGK